MDTNGLLAWTTKYSTHNYPSAALGHYYWYAKPSLSETWQIWGYKKKEGRFWKDFDTNIVAATFYFQDIMRNWGMTLAPECKHLEGLG